MNYKNYIADIRYDYINEIFHGEVVNIHDVITFQGNSIHALKRAFKDSIDDYIEFCKERNEKPETPLDGILTISLPYKKQKEIEQKAKKSGMNLSDWVIQKLIL